MSTKIVNIVGYAEKGKQFIAKTSDFDIRIGKNKHQSELDAPSPIEYVLAGYAGCINAVESLVANELNLDIQSLQVEISASMDIDKYQGKPTEARAGFKGIQVIVKPEANATIDQLNTWLEIVESRCPVYDNLLNTTPIISWVGELESVATV